MVSEILEGQTAVLTEADGTLEGVDAEPDDYRVTSPQVHGSGRH